MPKFRINPALKLHHDAGLLGTLEFELRKRFAEGVQLPGSPDSEDTALPTDRRDGEPVFDGWA